LKNENLKIETTKDGSHTIYNQIFDEHYHSINGAFAESMHIFIEAGFNFCNNQNINIFEVGFGTGLNAILTLIEAKKTNKKVDYFAIEKYPINENLVKDLNYFQFIDKEYINIFLEVHKTTWNQKNVITNNFSLTKIDGDLIDFIPENKYDIIYFDAFSYEKQPELWTESIFTKIYNSLNNNGILVTYSSKGIIKQNLRNSGFEVKRLPGPKGKRHILRAIKK